MRVHIIDQNTVHRHLIARMVVGAIPELKSLTFSRLHDSHSDSIDNADLVITSGGTWLIHKNPKTHKTLLDTLLAADKPVLGICLGAEAIADYFGAKLMELPHRQNGILSVRLTDSELKRYMTRDEVPVFGYHKWSIHNLPSDLESLAESDTGVEFFRHKSLPIWGTQFHPEVRRGKNEGYKFLDYIVESLLDQASDKA